MSARRRAQSDAQHPAELTDLADLGGRGGYGVHRSERQPAAADFRAVLGNFATGVTIITALDAGVPNRTASNGTAPNGAVSHGAASDAAAANGAVSSGAMPSGTAPNGAAPTEAVSSGAVPRGAVPNGAVPSGAVSSGAVPIGFTCQAFSSLSLEPPLVSFAVSRASSSRPRILAAGRFCVNILAFDQRGLCSRFATRGVDRFEGVDWWTSPGGSPILDGSLAWIDCTVEAEYPGGDHTIVIGRVRELSHMRDAAPLVFHRGEFAKCFPAAGPGALPRAS